MDIVIDIDSPVPLFSQLIEQIKEAVLTGGLAPGDALPSIRQLANDLDVNAKTVAKAYKLLERDSVIQTKGYRGTFIHPDAQVNSTIDLRALVTEKLSEAVEALRAAGATDSEIRIAFGELMKRRAR
ncbi:MAG: GntR family transcriptional regulator [Acidobacteriota bacterium]